MRDIRDAQSQNNGCCSMHDLRSTVSKKHLKGYLREQRHSLLQHWQ